GFGVFGSRFSVCGLRFSVLGFTLLMDQKRPIFLQTANRKLQTANYITFFSASTSRILIFLPSISIRPSFLKSERVRIRLSDAIPATLARSLREILMLWVG